MTMNFLSDFRRSKKAVLKVIKIMKERNVGVFAAIIIYNLSMILVWTVAIGFPE